MGDAPMDNITAAHLHPKGDSVVLTARGRVFVAPAKSGRLVQASRKAGVRYRDVVFMPDGKTLLGLSDASSELEFVQLPPNGVGAERALTSDGKVLRFRGVPSPDGALVAYNDNDNDAWILNVRTKAQTKISTNREGTTDFAWSPDSRYLAFGQYALNSFTQLFIYDVQTRTHTPLTSDRTNSFDPAWSPDGNWIYFLSDRNLTSVVGAPWGPRAPEPYFAKPDKIYQVALRKGLRSPFKPADELAPAIDEKTTQTPDEPTPPAEPSQQQPREQQEPEQLPTPEPEQPAPPPNAPESHPASTTPKAKAAEDAGSDKNKDGATRPKPVRIDIDGLARRIYEVPVPAGDYNALTANGKALYWLARDAADSDKATLMVLEITNEEPKPAKFADEIRTYELSADGKKMLMRKDNELFVVEAGTKAPSELPKSRVDLSAWSYSIDVREDWRQIFIDAWRLERDYFYDPNMHGVGYERVRDKYLPLVERVTTRAELSDVIGLAVGELSALHTAVREGDQRRGPDNVRITTLGARLALDKRAGGYRIDYIYQADPDYPHERSPLADPALDVNVGDILTMINGVDVLSVDHPNALLRNQARRQVLLRLKAKGARATRDVIVTPIDTEFDLRYTDWEYTRRLQADTLSNNKIGYVHLRAMTGADIESWFRNFYPVFNRPGLIIDARHNRGGNIDSFILARLLRKDWMYWKGRAGEPYANMQYAFRGHAVVLVDENTASDGEAFAEGFRRLGLGKVIGVRTWGGEIWLDSQNRLSDGGLARAPSSGVYGAEGKWLIEQHGVDPDVVVENLPHATFNGGDAQLEAAVKELLQQIEKDPRPFPQPPPYPVIRN
jgi:tricorn protease